LDLTNGNLTLSLHQEKKHLKPREMCERFEGLDMSLARPKLDAQGLSLGFSVVTAFHSSIFIKSPTRVKISMRFLPRSNRGIKQATRRSVGIDCHLRVDPNGLRAAQLRPVCHQSRGGGRQADRLLCQQPKLVPPRHNTGSEQDALPHEL